VDAVGNLYVTGWTEAINFPIVGAYDATNSGGVDAFVVKLNPTGTAIVYATYLGGLSDDRAAAIVVDLAGNAYSTGATESTNFPLVAPAQPNFGGGRDAFVTKLNPAGNALIYSTYLGGTNSDLGTGIAVDAAGNAYVVGDTLSANFPIAAAVQSVFGGETDAFLTKINSSGGIVFSTFLGGSGVEHVGGVAVDSNLNIYIAGGTFSTNFPTVAPIQSVNGGGQNAFITKLGASGTSIVYSTYLGGNGGSETTPEQANAIAVDGSGSVYVAGVTNSANFPVTPGAFETSYGGASDAFVAKVNAGGNAMVYSTYLGGSSFDQANGIAVDSRGNAYVAGYTSSGNFASVNGVQRFVRRVHLHFERGGKRAHVFYILRRDRLRFSQRNRPGPERQHFRWRPNQLHESSVAESDPSGRLGRKHRLGSAFRRYRSSGRCPIGYLRVAELG
jgi:hypothetical protein